MPWLTEPKVSMPYSQGLSSNPHPELNQSNPPINIYLFKALSNTVFPSTTRPFQSSLSIRLKALMPSSILATRPAHHLDLPTFTTLGERYKLRSSIVKPCPVSIRIRFSTKYFPKNPIKVFILSPRFSLNIRHHISQNTAQLVILLFQNSGSLLIHLILR